MPTCSGPGGTCGFTCNSGYKTCGSACIPNANCCVPGDCPAPPANGMATCTGGTCGFSCNAGFNKCPASCVIAVMPDLCGDGIDNDCDGTRDGPDCCTLDTYTDPSGSTEVTHKYLFCPKSRNFAAAQASCVAAGFTLAKVESEKENSWISEAAKKYIMPSTPSSCVAWIGGHDANNDDVWRWVHDGSAFWRGGPPAAGGAPVNNAFTAWGTGQPTIASNCNRLDYCGALWYALGCAAQESYVCENY
jgi:hypothetical protein